MLRKKVKRISKKGVLLLAILFLAAFPLSSRLIPEKANAAEHVGSQTCPIGGPSMFGREVCDGYFTGQDQYNGFIDIDNIIANPGGNDALWGVGDVDEFIDIIEAGLNGPNVEENTGTAYLIESMLGKPGTDFTTISGGVTQAKADFAYWEQLVRWYDMKGMVDWNASDDLTTLSNFINTGVSTQNNLDAVHFMDVGPKDRPLITFTNPDGSSYVIDKNCANPTGIADSDNPSGWTLTPLQPKVALGNFVWFDANNDGVVNGSDADSGFNGIAMNLYADSADTDNNGSLSAAEVAAATAAETTTTANDNRASSPTNGKAGYYEFTNLDPGTYFVCIAASNFGSGGVLSPYSASPIPSGVNGDSQTDKNSHGAVPTGGTAQAAGMCSTATTLVAFDEPTTTTGNADDDADAASDETIDFGFWHPYSLGNRVWIDHDNSGDINGADGSAPGVADVTVALYDCSGNQLQTTTTDSSGHYRFDNLSAGCYKTEVVAANFTSNSTLKNCGISSTGAKQSADPENNTDSDDNGIQTAAFSAARTGSIYLGPFNGEPLSEADLAASGQGTDDNFANMTLDFGFICNAALAKTGQPLIPVVLGAVVLVGTGAGLVVRQARRA